MGQRKKFTDKELEERKRERRHRYYMLHREELMKKNREYRRAHPDKIKGYNDKQKKQRRLQAERKKLERINPEVQASMFRDPQAAEHFKWLAERVKKKKEQSLNQSR